MQRSAIRDAVERLERPRLECILATHNYLTGDLGIQQMCELIVSDVESGEIDFEEVTGAKERTINVALTQGEVATIAEALKLLPSNDELQFRFEGLARDMQLTDYPES